MSRERDVDRTVREWLEQGPTQLPDDVLAAVQEHARRLPQRQRAGVVGRLLAGRSPRLLAAALVAATVVLSTLVVSGTAPTVGPTATPGPTSAAAPTSHLPATFAAVPTTPSVMRSPRVVTPPNVLELLAGRSFPMFKGNPARTGEGNGLGPRSGAVAARKHVAAELANGLAVTDALYVIDERARILGVGADARNLLWTTGDSGYLGLPAAVGLNLVSFRHDGALVTNERPTGFSGWSRPGPYDISVPPLVVGSLVVVVSEGGRIEAIDAETGEARWSRAAPARPNGLTASDGTDIFVGTEAGSVVAFAAVDGRQRWIAHTGAGRAEVAAVRDGVVQAIARGTDGPAGLVSIRAADGSLRWRVDLPRGASGSPVVDATAIYVTSDRAAPGGRVLSAFSVADGALLWTTAVEVTGGVTLSPDTAFAATPRGSVVAVALTDGRVRWESAELGIADAPLAVAGSLLYAGTVFGDVIVMGP